MNNNTRTLLIALVILLIFLYYRKKMPSKIGFGCADLWDSIPNASAEQIFYERMVQLDNDPDSRQSIREDVNNEGRTAEYVEQCMATASYLKAKGLVSENDRAKIVKCLCQRDIVE